MYDLRPETFEEYIGQEKIKKNLNIFIKSALLQNKTLDHILIHGPSGLGKTSLAYIIANKLNKQVIFLNGTSLQKASDIISPLTKLKEKHIIFIDEIHAVSKEVFETLYPVLEDNKLNIIIGKDYNSKTVNIKIPHFTLIGATTEINKINEPFYNRFPIVLYLSEYKLKEIEQIITNTCIKLGIKFDIEAISIIANNCKENPRIANNLIKRINDFFVISETKKLSKSFVKNVLKELGVYKFGLTEIEIEYLKTLRTVRSMGLNSLSQILNVPLKTLTLNIEPLLLKKVLIEKSNNGRNITQNGIDYLNQFAR